MVETKGARLLIGGMNILAASSPLLVSQVSHAGTADQRIEHLNMASLKSIESTWLNVPNSCKARAFNASPVSLGHSEVASEIQNIYASFGA